MNEIYQEPIIYQNPSLCLKIWRYINTQYPNPIRGSWHYHKEIEFIIIEEGIQECETPNNSYTLAPGDILLIGSSQLHRTHKISNENLQVVVLHFDLLPYFNPALMSYYSSFSELSQPLEELNYILQTDEVKSEVRQIIAAIHLEIDNKAVGYEFAISMYIHHLLLLLIRHDTQAKLPMQFQPDIAKIQPIIRYVDEHLATSIDMKEVCRLAGMSYSYFSKYFKQKLGMSFTEYVNRKRISLAERKVATEDMTIQAIAEAVGINNMPHFYELFKRYKHCTPKQYVEIMRR